MKALRYWKMTALVVAAVLVVACGSSRGLGRKSGKLQDEASGVTKKSKQKGKSMELLDTLQKDVFLQRVTDNAQTTRFVTSASWRPDAWSSHRTMCSSLTASTSSI